MRSAVLALVLLLATAIPASAAPVAAASVTSAAAVAKPALDYVALGDSYAAGPGIPDQIGTPPGCGRSNHNYPAVLAQWLRTSSFVDVTCSGATTVHMRGPHQVPGGVNPPQLDALSRDTDLVTLTIGGNDIGFGEILARCGQEGATDPTGDPCRRYYTSSGRDVLADRVAAVVPKITQVLADIRARSPHARILVVGYLRILPPTVGCWPAVPFATGDTPYFDATERLLNETIDRTATAARARFVDPYAFSLGHDACQPPEARWVEPLRPAAPAYPIHPNATGMRLVAALTWLTAHLTR
ncbi:SGNH/GDSL hydrolase family protein [Actinokineospora sp. HUAS TT18]|uniref:SGNH/GDSL hydrolase family protein n=1 Tax=Actinokineospora sp. HUAS TT18 TaxID=3447451 RepID=UPI003F51F97D